MAIAADGECGKCGGSKGFCFGAFRFFSTLRGASASIGDAEREREGTGARFAHSGLGAVRPESTAVLLLPCFGRASGLVAGEPPKTPHAGRGLREAVIARRRREGDVLVPVLREVERVAVPAAVRGDVHVVLVLLLVQRERVHLGEGHAAALSRRRQEQIRGGPAEPRPAPVPGASRGDGTSARRQTSPGTPTATRTPSPGTWKRMACSATPMETASSARGLRLRAARRGPRGRRDRRLLHRGVARGLEVERVGLDLARLLEVDLGFGCGSPGTADAGPLASRAWKSRAAGEDPGGSASEPPLVAPVPLPETSSAPFLNPPKPAWRCAFPLRS